MIPSDREEIASVLCAVLARFGVSADRSEISRRLASTPGDRVVGVAAGLGLRLRELHPPAAAEGLDQSAEFPAHFLDSYAPLIRRALAHGQIALAWKGWESGAAWGVILRDCDGVFEGLAAGSATPVRLIGAAHQVYIVEAFEPADSAAQSGSAISGAGGSDSGAAGGGRLP